MPREGTFDYSVYIPALSLPFAKPPIGFEGNGSAHPDLGDPFDLFGIFFKGMLRLAETVSAPTDGSRPFAVADKVRARCLTDKLSILENVRIDVNNAFKCVIGVLVELIALAPCAGEGNVDSVEGWVTVKPFSEFTHSLKEKIEEKRILR